MGTGVGEAALAAEAIGAAEAAGAIASSGALTSAAGAGIAEAGLLGGEFAGGLGSLGALTGGLGEAALLGGEFAGGLGSLAPALQTAVGGTAAFNPEIASQVAQFANVGAVPGADAVLGAGQIGDPALLAQQLGSGITNVNPAAPLYEMNALETADVMKHIDPNMVQGFMPMDTANAADMAERAQFAEAATKYPDLYPGNITPGGSSVYFPSGEAKYSFMEAPQVSSALEARAAAAPTSFDAFGNAVPVGSPSAMSADPTGMAQAQLEANTAAAAKSSPWSGLKNLTQPLQNWWDDQNKLTKYGLGATAAMQAAKYLNKTPGAPGAEKYNGPLSKFTYSPDTYRPYTYKPYAAGGPVEEMSRENAIGANTGYPQSDIQQGAYATPWQTPVSRNVVANAGDVGVDQMTGMERMAEGGSTGGDSGSADSGDTGIAALGPMMYSPAMMSSSLVDPAAEYAASQPAIDMSRQNFQNFLARYQNLPITEAAPPPMVYKDLYAAGMGPQSNVAPESAPLFSAENQVVYSAAGGLASLGGYSDGGRLLKGPGDGMSDNIPATIGRKQPARLADGEFVVPADVVSGLGNGSTEAGAKQLYKMLDKVRSARTGTKKQGKQIKPEKYTPA